MRRGKAQRKDQKPGKAVQEMIFESCSFVSSILFLLMRGVGNVIEEEERGEGRFDEREGGDVVLEGFTGEGEGLGEGPTGEEREEAEEREEGDGDCFSENEGTEESDEMDIRKIVGDI